VNFQDKGKEFQSVDTNIKSSLDDLDKFITGYVWKDIEAVLWEMLTRIRNELELMGTGTGYTPEEVPFALAYFQGQAFQIRTMLGLPNLLKTIKEETDDERPGNDN
jgi:hypothetical protein